MDDILPGIAAEFRRMGFGAGSPQWRRQPPKYAPYGCAVVPLTRDLLHLLTSLSPLAPDSIRDVLSRLADHWHLRAIGRDVISTGDGMAVIGLTLTPGQAEAILGRGWGWARGSNQAAAFIR